MSQPAGGRELAAQIVRVLGEREQTVAVAESLTGGLLGAAITDIPGASVVFRGGIIAYATELKAALLGLQGGRDMVRRGTVEQALGLLWSVLWEEGP